MKFLLFMLLLSTPVFAADKILWAPSGDWKILTTTSQKVNLNDTLYTTQDGKVGIGVPTPSLKLEVNGTVKATAAQIDTISNTAGTGAVTFSQGLTVTSGKVLKADSIQTTSGSPPPGFVPIGGMIAVMPTTAGTWQPPATGAIKDGFMRADGGSVPTCADCSIPQGTVLPDMRQRYPKGSNTGTSGATDGSNTVNAAFTGSSGTYSVSVPAHYHGFGTGSGLGGGGSVIRSNGGNYPSRDVSLGSPYGTGYGTCGSSDPIISIHMGEDDRKDGTCGARVTMFAIDHGHNGTIGLVTGGQNGNAAFSASGSNTPAGTVAVTPTTGTAGNNEPAYMEVVWVIRVK